MSERPWAGDPMLYAGRPPDTDGGRLRPVVPLARREDDVFRAAGFSGPERIELPGRTVERTVDEVRASVYSLSSAAPHLFAGEFDAFDGELRGLLAAASADGVFAERLRGITVEIRRP